MKNEFIKIILDFLKESGAIAIEYQNHLKASVKSDLSIVTEADTTISGLFRKRIDEYINSGNHVILDEENLPDKVEDLFKNNSEYLWTIDPIDGTTTYYHGFPLWAIAISLFKNRKPYIGAIYMPSMGELIYTDSIKTYFIQNAFSEKEIGNILTMKDQDLTNKSVILQHKFCDYRKDCTIIDLYACYVLSFYTLTGKSIASFFNKPAKLWDITATLPITKNLGLCFKNIKNNQELDELSSEIINDDWSLKDVYLMTNPDKYEKIKVKMQIA